MAFGDSYVNCWVNAFDNRLGFSDFIIRIPTDDRITVCRCKHSTNGGMASLG